MIAAVRGLGLGGYLNTSYPRGLAALLDRVPQRCAVLDVGTKVRVAWSPSALVLFR